MESNGKTETAAEKRLGKRARRRSTLVVLFFLCAAILVAFFAFSGRRRPAEELAAPRESAPASRPNELTAERILRETVAAYANAKYYRDEGYAEIVCERSSDRARLATRFACSLAFAKPNFARLELGRSLLRSDGKTTRAEIHDDAFAGQAIVGAAPLLFSSIREFYPDPEFAAAANFGIPPDVFWTSPQLALLFSKNPLRTLAPPGAKLKLLEPATLRGDGGNADVVCDRVETIDSSGARVYWISRATRALTRCELSIERVEAPEPDVRVLEARLAFPNQTLLQSAPRNLDEFAIGDDAATRRVKQFESPERRALNARFPMETIKTSRPDGTEEAFSPPGAPVALCLWNPDNLTSVSMLDRFDALAREFPDVAFYAATVGDSPRAAALADGREPAFRNARLDVSDPAFPSSARDLLAPPSSALLDETGKIVRLVFGSSDTERLRDALVETASGRDPRKLERNAFCENSRRFELFMERAARDDLFRSPIETSRDPEIPPRKAPGTMRLREVWRNDELVAPTNPLATSSISRADAWETSGFPARDGAVSDGALVVPCDGNALALLSPRGKLLRKTRPKSSSGEPIAFVRGVEYGDGRRFFVASASGASRRLHRFDERFNDLGSLEVPNFANQRVGDARFGDVDRDGIPELFLSVVSAPDAGLSAGNGIYAIDMKTNRVLWRDEDVVAPSQIAIDVDANDEERPAAFWALDFARTSDGAVVARDGATGAAIAPPRVKPGETLRMIATPTRASEEGARLVAVGVDEESDVAYFSGFDAEGNELWRNVIPTVRDERFEALQAGDLDGDGIDEWILATRGGVARVFNSSGDEIDSFQHGSEITGICVARWNDVPHLIVAEPTRISAWRVEPIRR